MRKTFPVLVAIGALAACGHVTDPSVHHAGATLSLSVATSGDATTAGASGAAALAIDTLVITSAELVLSHTELLPETMADCGADEDSQGRDQGHDECNALELEPLLVRLPVDNQVATALAVPVPPGTYRALETHVRALRGKEPGAAAFLAAHPEFAGVSVRVEGTFLGRGFIYTGSPEAKLELDFSPPLVVGASPVNVTLHIDLQTWFRDRSGTLIDPATATAAGATEALVAGNIRRSFRALRDDDRDGEADHDHHGG